MRPSEIAREGGEILQGEQVVLIQREWCGDVVGGRHRGQGGEVVVGVPRTHAVYVYPSNPYREEACRAARVALGAILKWCSLFRPIPCPAG